MTPLDAQSRYYNAPVRRQDADLASAARTVNGTGPEFSAYDSTSIIGRLLVSALTAGATLDLRLETSADDGASWYTVASFPQVTAVTAARVARVFGPVGQRCRWAWTIGGAGPSVTFDVTVEANRDD